MSFVLAEGTYTSYAVYDSFDDANIEYIYNTVAWINCLETKAVLRTYTSLHDYLKVYDIDTKTVGSTTELDSNDWAGVSSYAFLFLHTLLNTYVVFKAKTTKDLLIYKNGALLQTLTLTDLGLTAYDGGIVVFSPRGKYILLNGTRSASGNKGWVVLKGT